MHTTVQKLQKIIQWIRFSHVELSCNHGILKFASFTHTKCQGGTTYQATIVYNVCLDVGNRQGLLNSI